MHIPKRQVRCNPARQCRYDRFGLLFLCTLQVPVTAPSPSSSYQRLSIRTYRVLAELPCELLDNITSDPDTSVTMPLPANGSLSLQGHSRPGDAVHSKPKQAMLVRMSAETLEALSNFQNQLQMDFEFGDNPVSSYCAVSELHSLKTYHPAARGSISARLSFRCVRGWRMCPMISIFAPHLLRSPWRL